MTTRPARPESGFTLIEMLVAMSIFMVALALILPTLDVLTKSANSTDSLTAFDTAIRPALSTIGAQVSSAGDVTVLCASNTGNRLPACTTANGGQTTQGFGIVLYDETAADQLNASGTGSSNGTCYEWQLYNKQLQFKTWPASSTPPASFTTGMYPISLSNFAGTTPPTGQTAGAWQPPFAFNGSNVYFDFFASTGTMGSYSQLQTATAALGDADGGANICAAGTGQTW